MRVQDISGIAVGHASKAPIIHDVLDIFQRLYGFRPYKIASLPAEPAADNPYQMTRPGERQRTGQGTAIYGGRDLIGREVFLPVTISAGLKSYEFPYSILSMRRAKTVVETPMVERGGSVKELIGLEDWKISLKGFLIDPLNDFPDDQLSELHELFVRNEPVRLKCALSDLFLKGDDHVVIKELDIPAKAKVIGVRDFALSMVSDSILTLEAVK